MRGSQIGFCVVLLGVFVIVLHLSARNGGAD